MLNVEVWSVVEGLKPGYDYEACNWQRQMLNSARPGCVGSDVMFEVFLKPTIQWI